MCDGSEISRLGSEKCSMILTVVVPSRNDAARSLVICLKALTVSTRLPDEVIVVDDHSTDLTADLARRLGRAGHLAGRRGWGTRRGPQLRAARRAGRSLVLVDADVAVLPDALSGSRTTWPGTPTSPPSLAPTTTTHPSRVWRRLTRISCTITPIRRAARPRPSGPAAVQSVRGAFLACGGFDGRVAFDRRYRPGDPAETCVGYRVWSCPDVQAVHLKRWTFFSLIGTDIFLRAVPPGAG